MSMIFAYFDRNSASATNLNALWDIFRSAWALAEGCGRFSCREWLRHFLNLLLWPTTRPRVSFNARSTTYPDKVFALQNRPLRSQRFPCTLHPKSVLTYVFDLGPHVLLRLDKPSGNEYLFLCNAQCVDFAVVRHTGFADTPERRRFISSSRRSTLSFRYLQQFSILLILQVLVVRKERFTPCHDPFRCVHPFISYWLLLHYICLVGIQCDVWYFYLSFVLLFHNFHLGIIGSVFATTIINFFFTLFKPDSGRSNAFFTSLLRTFCSDCHQCQRMWLSRHGSL